jgi:hypothetical protein
LIKLKTFSKIKSFFSLENTIKKEEELGVGGRLKHRAGRAPAWQVEAPSFKPQNRKKKNKQVTH